MAINYKLKQISDESQEKIAQNNRDRGSRRDWHEDVPEDVSFSLIRSAVNKLWPLMQEEKNKLVLALSTILVNSALTLIAPLVVGYTIDRYIQTKDLHGLAVYSLILGIIYVASFGANFIQMRTMGGIGQRTLFRLRNALFAKIQELPVAFFNQNRAGDLISRINNDTDKLNQLFSQTLMQLAGNIFIIFGAAVFILVIYFKLGLAALVPALFLLVFTRTVSSLLKRLNLRSLQAEGAMSGEIQESLGNFKVILAFNRRDYFRARFAEANKTNFKTSVRAGYANNLISPLYDFAGNTAQLIVLAYGIYLVIHGGLAIGLIVSFLLYVSRFYDPLRYIASLWTSVQVSLAGWDRVSEILSLESDLLTLPRSQGAHPDADSHIAHHGKKAGQLKAPPVIEFKDVSFHYPEGKDVLHHINFKMEKGKTYALVGPTGGGKSTTASVIARLYDPTEGHVFLSGHDIRTYAPEERTAKVGFILQEPYLFTGTVRDNILYGNTQYANQSNEELMKLIKAANLDGLLERFENGLDTKVSTSGDTISLGQRQLIAFIRAVMRRPEILILDEATANIDTVTEQLLEQILKKLPAETTRVIIAHRLNTIENADEIFFVNAGTITRAGSFQHAVDMLLHGKRKS